MTMNKKSLFSLLLGLVFVFALAACGSDPVDDFLKDYEKFVVKYEELAKKDSITMDELNTLTKEATDFGAKAQKLGDSKPTEAQVKRAGDISQRMIKAMQSMQSKLKTE